MNLTRIHLATNKARPGSKEDERQRLQTEMQAFLVRGGAIQKLGLHECSKPLKTGMTESEMANYHQRQREGDVLWMIDRERRAAGVGRRGTR